MLLEETKKVLKQAGWYEGRKIDISKHIEFLEDKGYEVFDELKKFIEEFGDLKIILEDEYALDPEENTIEYSTCIIDIIRNLKKNINQDRKAGEKTIPVAELDNREILVYISESGKFYTFEGFWNSNTDKFWNCLFGGERERPLNWIELERANRNI